MSKRKNYCWLAFGFLFIIILSSFQKKINNENSFISVKLVFINKVKDSKLVLKDSAYINPFGEKYTITKLRYYVTDISLQSLNKKIKEKDSYHLIDESISESQSVNLSLPEGNYSSLQFLLGVDSLHNVSGAQTDDLDPTKDMFWTWNSGYVMVKMEGHSPQSTLVNNKFEYHIGGFSGTYNVLKEIQLNLPENFIISKGKSYNIFINADINTWWQNPNDVKISEHAIITTPGILAKNISDNYSKMFHVEKISSE